MIQEWQRPVPPAGEKESQEMSRTRKILSVLPWIYVYQDIKQKRKAYEASETLYGAAKADKAAADRKMPRMMSRQEYSRRESAWLSSEASHSGKARPYRSNRKLSSGRLRTSRYRFLIAELKENQNEKKFDRTCDSRQHLRLRLRQRLRTLSQRRRRFRRPGVRMRTDLYPSREMSTMTRR